MKSPRTRSLDRFSVSAVPFAAMEAIPQDGTYTPVFNGKHAEVIASGTYFERGDVLVAKITPLLRTETGLALDLPGPFG